MEETKRKKSVSSTNVLKPSSCNNVDAIDRKPCPVISPFTYPNRRNAPVMVFSLIGLPPPQAEITAFVQDKTALERGLFDRENTVPEELTQLRRQWAGLLD